MAGSPAFFDKSRASATMPDQDASSFNNNYLKNPYNIPMPVGDPQVNPKGSVNTPTDQWGFVSASSKDANMHHDPAIVNDYLKRDPKLTFYETAPEFGLLSTDAPLEEYIQPKTDKNTTIKRIKTLIKTLRYAWHAVEPTIDNKIGEVMETSKYLIVVERELTKLIVIASRRILKPSEIQYIEQIESYVLTLVQASQQSNISVKKEVKREDASDDSDDNDDDSEGGSAGSVGSFGDLSDVRDGSSEEDEGDHASLNEEEINSILASIIEESEEEDPDEGDAFTVDISSQPPAITSNRGLGQLLNMSLTSDPDITPEVDSGQVDSIISTTATPVPSLSGVNQPIAGGMGEVRVTDPANIRPTVDEEKNKEDIRGVMDSLLDGVEQKEQKEQKEKEKDMTESITDTTKEWFKTQNISHNSNIEVRGEQWLNKDQMIELADILGGKGQEVSSRKKALTYIKKQLRANDHFTKRVFEDVIAKGGIKKDETGSIREGLSNFKSQKKTPKEQKTPHGKKRRKDFFS